MIRLVTLDAVCEIIAGQSPPSSTYNNTSNGIPFFQGMADFGVLYPITRMWCTAPQKISLPNDILMSVRAPVGPTNLNNIKACIGRGLSAIRCSNKIEHKFLLYFLRHNEQKIADKGTGSTFKAITQKTLKSIEILLPPLAEQQKIAAILDAADSLRQKDQQLVERYAALSQSLFIEMFGDPDTNPKGFNKCTVGEQCEVKGGKRLPKGDALVKENTGYPYIKAGNIKRGKVTTKNLEFLTPETRNKLKNYIVNEGDVCITVVGANIGDIGIVPNILHHANLTENANKLLIKDHNALNSFYLCFSLQMEHIQQQIKKGTMAVGVPKLALFRIQQLELLLPHITLQNQFADRIKLIEIQKQNAEASLVKSEALFNSLLQRVFKGELTV